MKVQFDQHRMHALLLLPLFVIISLYLVWPAQPSAPSVSKPVYFVSIGDHGTGTADQISVAHQVRTRSPNNVKADCLCAARLMLWQN